MQVSDCNFDPTPTEVLLFTTENVFLKYLSSQTNFHSEFHHIGLAVACGTGSEFLSDAPFSNLVSARCALLSNCACVVGGVKLLNLKLAGTTSTFLLAAKHG